MSVTLYFRLSVLISQLVLFEIPNRIIKRIVSLLALGLLLKSIECIIEPNCLMHLFITILEQVGLNLIDILPLPTLSISPDNLIISSSFFFLLVVIL